MLTFGYDIETAGIDPLTDKLITIQYRREGRNHIFKLWEYPSEKDLIEGFLDEWKNIPRHLLRGGDYFVSFNFRLDGPFLFTRCLLNDLVGIPYWRKHLWSFLIHGPAFVDVDQLLGDKLTSLEEWRRRFRLKPGSFKNSQIPHLYKQRRFEDIEEYVNDELEALEQLYHALCKEPFYEELEKMRSQF